MSRLDIPIYLYKICIVAEIITIISHPLIIYNYVGLGIMLFYFAKIRNYLPPRDGNPLMIFVLLRIVVGALETLIFTSNPFNWVWYGINCTIEMIAAITYIFDLDYGDYEEIVEEEES